MIAQLRSILNPNDEFILDDFNIISDRNHELKEVHTIILKDCSTKHCAILKFGKKYKIIDMCSFKTWIKKDGLMKLLKPLEFYDLEDAYEITIGPYCFVFNLIENNSSTLVPGSPEFTMPFINVNSQHIELPETQDYFEYSQKKFVKFKEELKNDSDGEQTFNIQGENALNSSNASNTMDFLLNTQPVFNIPRQTRFQKRKQEELKPKTRPVHQLELTEDIVANYCQETQPFVLPEKIQKSQIRKRRRVERDLEFEKEFEIKSQTRPKINPIMLSDEEDEENDLSFSAFLKRKNNQIKEEPLTQISFIDDIPNVPSQILNDSEILMQINESQHKSDLLPTLDEEEEETKPEPIKRFFGETLKSQRKKKILKFNYDDDDDDDDD